MRAPRRLRDDFLAFRKVVLRCGIYFVALQQYFGIRSIMRAIVWRSGRRGDAQRLILGVSFY